MSEPETVVNKITTHIPMSAEMLADAEAMRASVTEWLNLSPEERRRRSEESAARALAERAQQRADATPRIPLTLSTLLAKLEWTPEYAEHYVQSYCGCEETSEGWSACAHAEDEGVAP
jgi:hypothetical protein